MPIIFECPGCASEITAPVTEAGKAKKCTGCGQPLKIPEPDPAHLVIERLDHLIALTKTTNFRLWWLLVLVILFIFFGGVAVVSK